VLHIIDPVDRVRLEVAPDRGADGRKKGPKLQLVLDGVLDGLA
jgi:hypothetical protein